MKLLFVSISAGVVLALIWLTLGQPSSSEVAQTQVPFERDDSCAARDRRQQLVAAIPPDADRVETTPEARGDDEARLLSPEETNDPWYSPDYFKGPPFPKSAGELSLDEVMPRLEFGLKTQTASSLDRYRENMRRELTSLSIFFIPDTDPPPTILQAMEDLEREYRTEMETVLPDYIDGTLDFRMRAVSAKLYTVTSPGDPVVRRPFVPFVSTSLGVHSASMDWVAGVSPRFDAVQHTCTLVRQSFRDRMTNLIGEGVR